MHVYLASTETAVKSLFSTVKGESVELQEGMRELASLRTREPHLWTSFQEASLSEDVDDIQEQHRYYQAAGASARINDLSKELAELKGQIEAHTISGQALCGAIFQIAKQGLASVYGGYSKLPTGHPGPAGYELAQLIWQCRNQAMHFEEGFYEVTGAVKKTSVNLVSIISGVSAKFPTLNIDLKQQRSYANVLLVDVLQWRDSPIT